MVGRHIKHARPVLLLIDFINHFQFEKADLLKPRAVNAARKASRLKQQMTTAGHRCIYVNDNFGKWETAFSVLVQRCLAQGGESAQIATLLEPAPQDLTVLKPRYSGFYGTPLEFLLQELNVTEIVITGLAADMCVLATAADAHMRKFKVRVPSDCVAGFSKKEELAALSIMARTMDADIRPYSR